MRTRLDRRQLLAGGVSLFGGLALSSNARAALRVSGELATPAGAPPRTLLLLQLSGGNDGLSTVVPFGDDAYHRARKGTTLESEDVLKLDDYRGLHPDLSAMRALYDAGKVAIVEGAGYADPVRSHFRSLEVWHTGERAGRVSGEGWVARLAHAAWKEVGTAELIVHVGRKPPYSLYSPKRLAIALASPTGYQWFGDEAEARAYGKAGKHDEEAPKAGRDEMLARLRGVHRDAESSSLRIRRAAASYKPVAQYPRSELGATLRDVAALVHGGLGSRVLSADLGGFDTHADQKGEHDRNMRTLDAALGAFLEDLKYTEEGRETLVLVFSEFGRRVKENASGGTDHGKAGPMFVLGHKVNGGVHGKHPSLTELDNGDLAFTTDFRSVYGTVIESWFGTEHERVLGERYPLLPLLKS